MAISSAKKRSEMKNDYFSVRIIFKIFSLDIGFLPPSYNFHYLMTDKSISSISL